jgi:hypothetical protein
VVLVRNLLWMHLVVELEHEDLDKDDKADETKGAAGLRKDATVVGGGVARHHNGVVLEAVVCREPAKLRSVHGSGSTLTKNQPLNRQNGADYQ